MALVLRLAVSAGSVQFTEVVGVEVLDRDGSGAVVLDDLVLGMERSATDNVGDITCAGLQDGQGI